MADTNFTHYSDNDKVIFFLGLSEAVLPVFSQKSDQHLAQGSSG